ncbi:MAG: MotA/TolQ/ExbB proton channel family protein [Syntrophotalea acetylenica]|jgi:biopolymer transport protein ExbB|uniref:MotA/TolQ/ExbB proton channel family protein n=1 Tax=Syntrophotalea TaxID=2812025 RepID=UPI002A36D409|nr:MotA/TolQ/ExbB proton channel family protein [Syntrophotalea acetylenica]MDD4456766.1 MotA/TolQ/ExbB proton channel family protein [Syntrophotalea acetylenica]MDY0263302.1 MotA/TolQ/ExbB proton channel family protein [Syntrophotalea acetylenica]
MLELFQKGGPLMYPILLCSIMALAIFFERLWTFFRVGRGRDELVRDVEQLVLKNRIDEAVVVCQRSDTPLSRILLSALRAHGRSRDQIKTVVEETGSREAAPLERFLGLLGTIATISPLLGLLGTVLGMIRAFTVIATVGMGTPETLGGGISEALITTAAGLSVAIPVILLHKYLTSRLDHMVLKMEESSLRLVDLLGE